MKELQLEAELELARLRIGELEKAETRLIETVVANAGYAHQLEAALKKHGRHGDNCTAFFLTADLTARQPCTCGLEEALSRAG